MSTAVVNSREVATTSPRAADAWGISSTIPTSSLAGISVAELKRGGSSAPVELATDAGMGVGTRLYPAGTTVSTGSAAAGKFRGRVQRSQDATALLRSETAGSTTMLTETLRSSGMDQTDRHLLLTRPTPEISPTGAVGGGGIAARYPVVGVAGPRRWPVPAAAKLPRPRSAVATSVENWFSTPIYVGSSITWGWALLGGLALWLLMRNN